MRVLAALALLFLSFAHQPVFAAVADPVLDLQYRLPDGTIADICFGSDGVEHDGHKTGHDGFAPVCDACRLSASMLLPSPPDTAWLLTRADLTSSVIAGFTPVFVDHPRPLPPSRAPPVIL